MAQRVGVAAVTPHVHLRRDDDLAVVDQEPLLGRHDPSLRYRSGLVSAATPAAPAAAADALPALAIELKGLRKTYAGGKRQPPKVALHGVDLEVPRGSVF